ncbi:DNA circularization protein [Pseudomonas sp. zfem002]|uniref:DNA circularization protein n=1 Tax=Pseudomonas sp. zfem002 TaxID=3078197 RepID=UPI002929D5A1|nr:DNA circularization N-terminal domain-containing protein [Pseudomonas sp. zfem002]MDU9391536.1 DNA circularization N-terminal domain-containing protein [Pseudomonas sp. zfem002]
MKTWRDDLHAASFRGVPFHVDSDSMPVGRRTQLHEYPQRDKPLVEDMGRVTRTPKFSAFVIGDDCFVKRDDLLHALDQPGPGELIHPWFGRMMVTAGSCEVTHERREGGVVRFDLMFYEDGEKGFPVGVPNSSRQLEESSESMLESAIKRYKTAMAVVNRARLAVVALQNGIAGLQQSLYQEFGKIVGLVRSVEALADMLINFPGNFSAMIRAQFADLAGGSRSSGYRWGASANSSSDAGGAGAAASASELDVDPDFARTVAALGPDGPTFTTYVAAAREIVAQVEAAQALATELAAARQAGNVSGGLATAAVVQAARELGRDALIVLAVRTAAAMPVAPTPIALPGCPSLEQQAAEPIQRSNVPSVDEVVALRDALDAVLWEAAQHVDRQHFEVMETVRRAVKAHLTAVARTGVRLTQVTTTESVPAVVLAYQCFGDATRAAEIVTRNKVNHPGFLPIGALTVAQE